MNVSLLSLSLSNRTARLAVGAALMSVTSSGGCSVYTDGLLEQATGESGSANPGTGGANAGGSGATGGLLETGGQPQGSGGQGDGGTAQTGGASAGGQGTGSQMNLGGVPDEPEPPVFECTIEPLVDPSSLPTCGSVGHPTPSDGDLCSAGEDCQDAACGFAALGTKTCTCKADGTFNCTCQRPAEYLGQCPEGAEGCNDLNECVRGPSCFDYDLENTGPAQGTRAAMHGDLCGQEWSQCVTVDAPASDGCVCMKVSSSLPEWVCKDREGWFEAI